MQFKAQNNLSQVVHLGEQNIQQSTITLKQWATGAQGSNAPVILLYEIMIIQPLANPVPLLSIALMLW